VLDPQEPIELETLEFTASDVCAESRLACQIRLTEAQAGLVLQVVGA
jgi:hypothetical protein